MRVLGTAVFAVAGLCLVVRCLEPVGFVPALGELEFDMESYELVLETKELAMETDELVVEPEEPVIESEELIMDIDMLLETDELVLDSQELSEAHEPQQQPQQRRLFKFAITEGTARDQLYAFCRLFLQDLLELDEREEEAAKMGYPLFLEVSRDRQRSANPRQLYTNRVAVVHEEDGGEVQRVLEALEAVGRFPMNRPVYDLVHGDSVPGREALKKVYLSAHHVSQADTIFDELEAFFGAESLTHEYRQFVKRIFKHGLMKAETVLPLMERLFQSDLEMMNAVVCGLVKRVECPEVSEELLAALPKAVAAALRDNQRARASFMFHLTGSIEFASHQESLFEQPITINSVDQDKIEIVSDFEGVTVTIGSGMTEDAAYRCLLGLKLVHFEGLIRHSSSDSSL